MGTQGTGAPGVMKDLPRKDEQEVGRVEGNWGGVYPRWEDVMATRLLGMIGTEG